MRSPSPPIDPRADALLGRDHPLVRALERLRIAIAQSVVVGALLAAGVIALIAGLGFAVPLVVAAAVVELVLVCGVAGLAGAKRSRVLELISAGGGDLPIAAVEETRARLLEPETRSRLARDLDTLRTTALKWTPTFRAHPLTFDPAVIVALAPELSEIADLLRADRPGLPGIALVESSLADGTSALYGTHAGQLREHLGRIRFLLAAPG